MIEYGKLQNGSDIRGTAIAVPGGKNVDLTQESVRAIGGAFVQWLEEKRGITGARIAIGRDSRLSGEAMAQYLGEGLCESGADVVDFGMATTPAMFMSVVLRSYSAAIMITASHLPFERNGLKFFTIDGGLDKADISEILQNAAQGGYKQNGSGNYESTDFMVEYADYLKAKIRVGAGAHQPLEGLHIIVDAGNGAGGFFANEVLAPLGANTFGSLFLEPDGNFPNHPPNPEDKTAMASIRNAVLETKADLGIIFDTDVDRAGAVLPDGSELNRNRLIAMLSAMLLREHPGTTIVTDSITSTGLAEFIAKHGGIHHRFKRGYRNVINEAKRLCENGQEALLAIETSGHGALKENYFLDDGAYLMVKLLVELAFCHRNGETLASRIADLREPVEAREFRLNILNDDFAAYGEKVLCELKLYVENLPGFTAEKENYEGVRVNADEAHGNGWFLLRMSLHDPLMPLNIESESIGGAKTIAREIYRFLKEYGELNLEALKGAVE